MEPEFIQHLGETFHEADNSITRRFGGTGLGLSICIRLLALMNSRLEVKSVLGEGSDVSFVLSLEEASVKAENGGSRIARDENQDRKKGLQISLQALD